MDSLHQVVYQCGANYGISLYNIRTQQWALVLEGGNNGAREKRVREDFIQFRSSRKGGRC
jgi:hypothetical protein